MNFNLIICLFLITPVFSVSQKSSKEIWKDTLTSYYESGQVKSQTVYSEDKTQIIYKGWYENGQLDQLNVFEGNVIKKAESYYESGVKKSIKYNNGSKSVDKSWYESGEIESYQMITYRRSIYKYYNENGVLLLKRKGKNGLSMFDCIPLNKNGQEVYGQWDCIGVLGEIRCEEDSVYRDVKGRDVLGSYSEKEIHYFPNRKIRFIKTKKAGENVVFVQEWDQKGNLKREEYENFGFRISMTM